ncbi:MAG: DUF4942 domain-containing protein [Clostridia bacterium]|nr:DUF4942 domain-containing protein [Clostridia bacterium]
MFNKEFYPTPKWLVQKMLDSIDIEKVKYILEPSAGKGDIIDAIKEKYENTYRYNKPDFDIDAIEVDENLRLLLKGKEYKVVFNDFLNFNTYKKYDLIIMNPPFSCGDQHLLKAIEMQKDGGAIICLLNAETIRNPYSNIRKDLKRKLTELGAKIEFLENAFVYAENETNVEIALVKICILPQEKESFILNNLRQEERVEEYQEKEYTDLIKDDFVKQIVDRYNMELEAGIKLINEHNAIKPFILKEIEGEYDKEAAMLKLILNEYKEKKEVTINDFVKAIRKKYWKALFSNKEFIKRLTNNLRTDYYNRVEELKEYDFSIYNIYTIRCEMQNKTIKGIEDTILGLFEEFSEKYHWYNETSNNIHYYNGWKTNKAWIINKKVIIPLDGFSSYSGKPQYGYNATNKLLDVEKVFNYLDGNITANISLENALKVAENIGQTKKIHLKFFDVTFYKKGTCHIEFTNLDLLKKFNIYGSQRKSWLPPTYGKIKYDEMTAEEKSVIDEFEGKESYQKTMANTKYFIVESKELLQLAA